MRRLVAIGLGKHPDLINMAINSGVLLNDAGRHGEAAKYADELFRVHPDKASKYGQMWMWSTATCGHALGATLRRRGRGSRGSARHPTTIAQR